MASGRVAVGFEGVKDVEQRIGSHQDFLGRFDEF